MALEPLDAAIQSLRAVLEGLSSNLQADVAALLGEINLSGEDLIDDLQLVAPSMLEPYAAAAADYTVQWYNDLAPNEPFQAVVPAAPDGSWIGGVIDPARLATSIEWAVHTAKDASPADKLAGAMDRMVHDASRHVVSTNAAIEGVKYLRHAAPGACPWCRLMAIRGAVFKSAAAAIKGHDSCHCVAVPIRKGTKFTPPAHYAAWEKEYEDARKVLKADAKQINLSNVLAEFEKNDQAVVAAAEQAIAKKEQIAAKIAKNKIAKAKAETKAITDWLSAEATHKQNVTKWLVAEAQFGEITAKKAAKKSAKAAAQAKYLAKKKAEKEAALAATSQTEKVPDQSKLLGWISPPNPADLFHQGDAGGSHGAQFWLDNKTGQKWIVKQQSEFHIQIEKGVAELQALAGLPAPATYKLTILDTDSLVQEVLPGKLNWQINGPIPYGDALQLQKNQIFDWLIGNHDASAEQWIKTEQWIKSPNGTYVGVDKGQAFKWYGKDKLDPNFKPNGESDTPIYNLFWQNYINGHQPVAMYDAGPLHEFIQHVQGLDDDTVKSLIRPYAEAAASKSKLINTANDAPGLLKSPGVPPNDVEAFLNAVVARKNNLQNDFDAFYANVTKAKEAIGGTPSTGLPDWEVELLSAPTVPTPPMTAPLGGVQDAFTKAKAKALGKVKLSDAPLQGNPFWDQYQQLSNMTPEEFGKTVFYVPESVALPDDAAALQLKILELSEKALAKKDTPLQDNGFLTQLNYLYTLSPDQFKQEFPSTYQTMIGKIKAAKVAAPKTPSLDVDGQVISGKPVSVMQAHQFAIQAQQIKKAWWDANSATMGENPYVDQLNKLTTMTSTQFAEKYGIDNWVSAVGKHVGGSYPPNSPAYKAWQALSDVEKKKVGKALASKKWAAKKKGDTDALDKYSVMPTWKYYAEQQNLSTENPKGFLAETPVIIEAPKAPTFADYSNTWNALAPDEKKKIGKQLAAKKHVAKKKLDPNDGSVQAMANQALFDKYDAMTPFDYWVTTQDGIKVPTGPNVNVSLPPKNPPTDAMKIAKVNELAQQYAQAKPTGTGFNPVKGLHPELNLKDPSALVAFDNEIGVGYLTEDQLLQVLAKATVANQKKWLKKYADAKGQNSADTVQAKLASAIKANKPSSSGVKPNYTTPTFDPSTVTIKDGTQHTLARTQHTTIAEKLGKKAVPDVTAPLGSSANPHVFTKTHDQDFKTFGALHTEQNKSKWEGHQQGIGAIQSLTGSWYTQILAEMRTGKFTNPKIAHMDKAFHSPYAKPTEEWMIIARGTGRREFNSNETGIKLESAGHATPDDFKHLVGKTYTNDGYMETSITQEPGYGKTVVRVVARIPPGSRMIYADGEPNGYHSISQNAGEREIVFPRNSTWRVLEVKKSTLPGYQVDVIVELEKQNV